MSRYQNYHRNRTQYYGTDRRWYWSQDKYNRERNSNSFAYKRTKAAGERRYRRMQRRESYAKRLGLQRLEGFYANRKARARRTQARMNQQHNYYYSKGYVFGE